MIHKILIIFGFWLVVPFVLADDIDGFWMHTDESLWIEIRLDERKGSVIRRDKNPEHTGREILRGLKADGAEQNRWFGQVYVERLGEYRDVEVVLIAADRMQFRLKVGFMRRTVEWLRVDVPDS